MKGQEFEESNLLVMVSAAPFDEYGRALGTQVLAQANACQTVDALPTMIGIHVNSYYLDNALTSDQRRLLESTILHEVMHGLGFGAAGFMRKDMISTTQQSPQRQTQAIQDLEVVEVQKAHLFGGDLAAAEASGQEVMLELEDDGGNGTQWQHWEKRTFGNELMVGNLSDNPAVSAMTLTLFQRLGYQIDWAASAQSSWSHHSYTFGRGTRLDLISTKCISQSPTATPVLDYQCVTEGAPGCSPDREYIGYCKMIQKNSVKDLYKGNSQLSPYCDKVGFDKLNEYCPMYKERIHCKNKQHQNYNSENTHGPNSMCVNLVRIDQNDIPMDHSVIPGSNEVDYQELIERENEKSFKDYQQEIQDVNCFEISCDQTNLSYTVDIGGHKVTCKDYPLVPLMPNKNYSVKCDRFDVMCRSSNCLNNCSGRGICSKYPLKNSNDIFSSKCNCDEGFEGVACEIKTGQNQMEVFQHTDVVKLQPSFQRQIENNFEFDCNEPNFGLINQKTERIAPCEQQCLQLFGTEDFEKCYNACLQNVDYNICIPMYYSCNNDNESCSISVKLMKKHYEINSKIMKE